MGTEIDPGVRPKSLADILEEELDGRLGKNETQELPIAEKQARLHAVYERIRTEEPQRSALCLSGGGIRSAIFSLGILQGLARKGLLQTFDYLSTVSGGGYVGGWLTAWIKNHPRGAAGVIEELQREPDLTLNPEPQPIRHLRAFSNYLTPRNGFFSVDSWTLLATYVRNIFLNWLVLISWLAAAMMAPRLYLAAVLLPPEGWTGWANYQQALGQYHIAMNVLLGVSFILVAVGMAYAIVDVPSTGNAGFRQSRFLWFRQLPLGLAALALTEWWALLSTIDDNKWYYSTRGLLCFIGFPVTAYLFGGLMGSGFLWFRRRPAAEQHPVASILRLSTIFVTTAFGGFCLWLVATRSFSNPANDAVNYVCFAPAVVFSMLLLVNFLFTGLASWVSQDQDREWWARSAAWILIMIFGWIAVNFVVLWGAQIVTTKPSDQLAVFLGQVRAGAAAKALVAALGGATGVAGVLLTLRSKFGNTLGSRRIVYGLLVAVAVVFFVLLAIILSWIFLILSSHTTAMQRLETHQSYRPYQNELFLVFLVTAGTLLFGIVMGFFINVNKFSLHATYRTRLIRAFLGASRIREARRPHLFTGFDPDDNIFMRDLSRDKPFHVINAALNLVKGKELAWQERRAESFTISRLHCGSWHLGYRPSSEYGDKISLGTALTISGAAANPNMGYHSSPIVGFLMTLFNVRLGWWLGNPGSPGKKTWRRGGPRYAVGPLFSEALGNTTDCYKYVNLSDGGHFENLGLYEMVLRRCQFILLVDAGQDFDYVFEDLGNAIRKIRIDLGIPIEIKVVSPRKLEKKDPIPRCAFGTIRYSEVDKAGSDGSFIYIKPVIAGDEPPDVSNYAAAHPEFPHEPTTDQWFSESQLESYRLLGLHTVETICGPDWKQTTLPQFFAQVKKDLTEAKPKAA